MNSIGYSVPLPQKTFVADEISQKLNNWCHHILYEMAAESFMFCLKGETT